ncbi:MAG: hypothetical protein RQ745_09625, partial [Longimicrobiales bacterium]|nr:hypothetical protein [Longimicrobiales bacterium]
MKADRLLGAATRVVVGAALVVLIGGLSRVPFGGVDEGAAALRLTWRLRGEEAAPCRTPTEAELADLPVHMRNPDACIGDLPPFALRVTVDGEVRVERIVRPSGARGDRPLFVYEELPLPPGRHALEVRFGAVEAESA